jgi:hypothetical protein
MLNRNDNAKLRFVRSHSGLCWVEGEQWRIKRFGGEGLVDSEVGGN